MPIGEGGQKVIDVAGNWGAKTVEELGMAAQDPVSPLMSFGSDTIAAMAGVDEIVTRGPNVENVTRTLMKGAKVATTMAQPVIGSQPAELLSQVDYGMRDQYDLRLYGLGAEMWFDQVVNGVQRVTNWIEGGPPLQGIFQDGVSIPALPEPLPEPVAEPLAAPTRSRGPTTRRTEHRKRSRISDLRCRRWRPTR